MIGGLCLVPACSMVSFTEISWSTCLGDRLSIAAICSSVNFRLGPIIPAAFSVSTFDVCGFGMGVPSGVNCFGCWLVYLNPDYMNRRSECQGGRSQATACDVLPKNASAKFCGGKTDIASIIAENRILAK